MTTHVYSEEAEEELVSALNYYRAEARLGAAEKFIERVDQAIESILRTPEGCPAFGRRIRRQRVWSFPDDLLFRFESDVVTIVAVAHHSRDSAFGIAVRSLPACPLIRPCAVVWLDCRMAV